MCRTHPRNSAPYISRLEKAKLMWKNAFCRIFHALSHRLYPIVVDVFTDLKSALLPKRCEIEYPKKHVFGLKKIRWPRIMSWLWSEVEEGWFLYSPIPKSFAVSDVYYFSRSFEFLKKFEFRAFFWIAQERLELERWGWKHEKVHSILRRLIYRWVKLDKNWMRDSRYRPSTFYHLNFSLKIRYL